MREEEEELQYLKLYPVSLQDADVLQSGGTLRATGLNVFVCAAQQDLSS